MTQEEKQLLLKDLCARLPYGVKYCRESWNYEWDQEISVVEVLEDIDKEGYINYHKVYKVWDIKPYLRPMPSMTEEEKKELNNVLEFQYCSDDSCMCESTDWLNEHHFDYRGLIPMGLAIEAPEGMYNKEESEKGGEIPIPKTVDEAVKTLAKIVSKEDRDYLLENGAVSMHDSLGRWIRNEWGLWTDSELKNELKKKGFEHPDDMSNYIIEEFIKYWNNKL